MHYVPKNYPFLYKMNRKYFSGEFRKREREGEISGDL